MQVVELESRDFTNPSYSPVNIPLVAGQRATHQGVPMLPWVTPTPNNETVITKDRSSCSMSHWRSPKNAETTLSALEKHWKEDSGVEFTENGAGYVAAELKTGVLVIASVMSFSGEQNSMVQMYSAKKLSKQ